MGKDGANTLPQRRPRRHDPLLRQKSTLAHNHCLLILLARA